MQKSIKLRLLAKRDYNGNIRCLDSSSCMCAKLFSSVAGEQPKAGLDLLVEGGTYFIHNMVLKQDEVLT